MEKFNIVIAESQHIQAEIIASMIQRLRPTWKIVATTTTVAQTLDIMNRYQPDLVLLEIGLQGPTFGLDIAAEIAKQCAVIFVTGQPSHALAAYDMGAIDYLIKPIQLSRLEQAFIRTEQILSESIFRAHFEVAGEQSRSGMTRYLQLISSQSSVQRKIWTSVGNVRYLQAETGYTQVFLDHSSGLIRHSLQTVFQRLNHRNFWQIHRGTVINANYIQDIERDEIGRMSVGVIGYYNRLIVAKNQEKLFRDEFAK